MKRTILRLKNIAEALKDLGFKEMCFACWIDNEIEMCPFDIIQADFNSIDTSKYNLSAPLWQQVIDWIREKHDLIVYVSTYQKDKHLFGIFTYGDEELTELGEWIFSYSEAREQAILKAIQLIK